MENTAPPVAPQPTPALVPRNSIPEPEKPRKFSDEQARALLELKSLDAEYKVRGNYGFLIFVIAFIIIIVIASLALQVRNNSRKPAKSSSSSSQSTSGDNPFTSSKGSIDSEVKYCQNPVNAQLTC